MAGSGDEFCGGSRSPLHDPHTHRILTGTYARQHADHRHHRALVVDDRYRLLILRIGVAATMIQAGLMKAFDFGKTVGFMDAGGWKSPTLGALMVTAAETAGGLGLLVGLLTPLAASAVAGAMICAWAVNVSQGTVWSEPFQRPVPAVHRRDGVAVHRRGRVFGGRQVLGRPRGHPGSRSDCSQWPCGGGSDMDPVERDKSDSLQPRRNSRSATRR